MTNSQFPWMPRDFRAVRQFLQTRSDVVRETRPNHSWNGPDWPRTPPSVTIGCTPEFKAVAKTVAAPGDRSVVRRRLRETVKDLYGSAGRPPERRLIGSRWRQRTAAFAKKI